MPQETAREDMHDEMCEVLLVARRELRRLYRGLLQHASRPCVMDALRLGLRAELSAQLGRAAAGDEAVDWDATVELLESALAEPSERLYDKLWVELWSALLGTVADALCEVLCEPFSSPGPPAAPIHTRRPAEIRMALATTADSVAHCGERESTLRSWNRRHAADPLLSKSLTPPVCAKVQMFRFSVMCCVHS